MRLGGKVDYGARLVLRQQAGYQGGVANVALHEDVARIALQAGQVVQVACVGEFVEIKHRLFAGGKPVKNKVGADEAGAAGDKNHDVV
jgi:hypothetical protein